MTRKEALTDLLEKVKAGETPEAHEVVAAMGENYDQGIACVSLVRWACDATDIRAMGAALALHEAVLPGWGWRKCNWDGEKPDYEVWWVSIPNNWRCGQTCQYQDSNHARAWLIAILQALIAQEGDQ